MELKRVIVKPYDKYKFEVVEPYAFKIVIEYKDGLIEAVSETIPKGYTTDGASIPRIFWSFYPPYKSEYFSACVMHDYLCSKAIHEESKKKAYKRADLVFYRALRILGVSKMTSLIFYHWVDKFHRLKCYFKGWE